MAVDTGYLDDATLARYDAESFGAPTPAPRGDEAPAAPKPAISLRPYQLEALDGGGGHPGIEAELARVRSTLAVMPTGAGKTILFGELARRWVARRKRVLILAHRDELIRQAVAKLEHLGVESAVEKAGERARDGAAMWGPPKVVVGSVQTLQGRRLSSWDRDYFDLIIVDEGHHAAAESYVRILAWFASARVLMVTATADRLDGVNLGDGGLCRSVAYTYSLDRAIREGYLVPLEFIRVQPSPPIDLSAIKTTGGDLNAGDLEDAIRPHIEQLANITKPEIGDRPAVVFCPDVGSADAFASGLRSIGVDARSVAGADADRKATVAAFERGEFQVLTNCQLLTEGWDSPRVSAVVLARPTKSRALYTQMIGRGTRLCEGKRNCRVVDFAFLTGKHELISPVELFDTGKLDIEVERIARELLESGKVRDVRQAIAEAERIHHERQRLRVQVAEREMRYRRVSYDPIGVADVLDIPQRRDVALTAKNRATPGQVRALDAFGVKNPAQMTRAVADRMLDELNRRKDEGLATFKQVAWLIQRGVNPDEARALSKEDASKRLDVLFGKATA